PPQGPATPRTATSSPPSTRRIPPAAMPWGTRPTRPTEVSDEPRRRPRAPHPDRRMGRERHRLAEGEPLLAVRCLHLADGVPGRHLTDALLFLPALALIPLFALLAWAVRSWRMGVGTLVMMLVVVAMDQWTPMLQTMALVIVATVFAVLIAVPLGILAAMNSTVSAVVKPIMDFMQTMPAFVYLIPAVTFF